MPGGKRDQRFLVPLLVASIAAVLINLACLIFVVTHNPQTDIDTDKQQSVCVSCEELTQNGSISESDYLFKKLNRSHDPSLCCVDNLEQMSALIELFMREPEQDIATLPVYNATNFSLSKASAHRRLGPTESEYDETTEPTFNGQNLKLDYTYIREMEESAEHVRNVNITKTGMTITIPGTYLVYYNLHFLPDSSTSCKHFNEQKWRHYGMMRRSSQPDKPVTLMSGTYTCCDECYAIHETEYAAGVFNLQVGDQLHVEVSGYRLISYQYQSTFLGAFMIG